MPGRKFVAAGSGYRYGFNGKEQDKETTGTSTYDYGFRIYNPALGRFLSVDPLTKSYPWNSTYSFAENDVIRSIDLDGLEKYVVTNYYNSLNQLTQTTITIVTDKKTGDKQDMNLRYDYGKQKGESVSQGYDVLIREVRENSKGNITTQYQRKKESELSTRELGILANGTKQEITGAALQPGFGGKELDGGQSITGAPPGFNEKQYELASYTLLVPVPPPARRAAPTQSQINTAVNNLAALIDLNSSTISNASRTAAANLGQLLLAAPGRAANLDVTFLDPTGANSFSTRKATNGSTFGTNVKSQIQAMANIIQRLSGKTITPSVYVTPTAGTNGASLTITR